MEPLPIRFSLGLMVISSGLSVAAFSSPTHAKNIELQPSSAWNIDYAPNKCRLARVFGDDEERHLLFFEQYWPGQTVGLTAAGPALKRFRSRERTYLGISNLEEPTRTQPFVGEIENVGTAVIYSSVNLADSETEEDNDSSTAPTFEQLDTEWASNAEFISLKQGGRSVAFRTGPLGKAFAALKRCSMTLLTEWGVDAEKHETAQSLPKWENEKQIVRRIASSYPRDALRRGEQAILRMRVMVDESGHVTDCIINEATSTERLQSPACEPMARAKFSPALDAEGRPFASYYVTSITYRIGR